MTRDLRAAFGLPAPAPLRTLDEALSTGARLFDDTAAAALDDAEDVLLNHGATDEELRLELARLRSDLAEHRLAALQTIRAIWETGAGVQ